jgi:hypothetical protein
MAFSSRSALESLAQVVLFQEDFEAGRAEGWELEGEWHVERTDGNYILSGAGHHFAYPNVAGWSDCIIEARVKILSGGFHFNVRESGSTGHVRYFLGLSESGSGLNKQIGSDFFSLPAPGIAIGRDNWHIVKIILEGPGRDNWHIVKIILEGPNIKIYVDDVLVLDYTDTDNPILCGRFSFETLDDSSVHFDDVIVTDLSQPEIICGNRTALVGDSFSLDVKLAQNALWRLAGFQFDLFYDGSLLQAVEITYGDVLSRDSGTAYYNEPTIDNTEGQISSILCARTSEGGLRGDGVLATITFKAMRAGESAIKLQKVKLSDSHGQRIEATITDGSINIHVLREYSVHLVEGINLISVPLDDARISKLNDLADVLGGTDAVTMIISYDTQNQQFLTYRPTFPVTSLTNVAVVGGAGYIVVMKTPQNVNFEGLAWPGDVSLTSGINLIAVPVNDARISKLSDLSELIGTDLTMVISYDTKAKKFVTFMPTFPLESPANVAVAGGTGYIVVMKAPKSIGFEGESWASVPAGTAPSTYSSAEHDDHTSAGGG